MAENYGRLTLLFVDDAPYTRQLLREVLRHTYWHGAGIVDSAAAAFSLDFSNAAGASGLRI